MAGVIGLVNLLGEPSADRIATGIGAERDVGVPEGRQTVIVTRGDMPMTGRIGLTTGANNGNGSLLQEIGTTGVFTGVAPGDVYGIGDQVRAAHAGAGANPPNAWSSAANSAAALSAHGGDIRRVDQTPQAASLNLTVRQWGTSFDLFPRGIAKSVPDLVNNLSLPGIKNWTGFAVFGSE